MTYKTLKSAYADGWRDIDRRFEYGGIQIVVKNHVLVKQPLRAFSQTSWAARGRKVKRGAEPHAILCHLMGGKKMVTYGVYRQDQTEATPAERERL